MRAVSLHQPWASAVALGAKRIETRSWSTKYRGPLAIHAAKRLNKNELIHYGCVWNWCGALRGAGKRMGDGKLLWDLLPFGAIVATCNVVDCRDSGSFTGHEIDAPRRPDRIGNSLLEEGLQWTERQMGDFTLGRFGWVLENIQALATPVPFKGMQGFFNVPDELLRPHEIACANAAAYHGDIDGDFDY